VRFYFPPILPPSAFFRGFPRNTVATIFNGFNSSCTDKHEVPDFIGDCSDPWGWFVSWHAHCKRG